MKMNLKEQFARLGVDLDASLVRFQEKKKEFRKRQSYDWDVSTLGDWKDTSLPTVVTDLIENSDFLSTFEVEEGVKGTKEIMLLNGDITLQAKTGCAGTPDGSMIFTGVDLTTVPIYAGIEFCNENLNTKITQILNVLGLKKQNGQLPAELEDIIMAYLMRRLQRKAQRVVVLGDDTSLDAELALFDGLVKIIDASATAVVYNSLETSITATNAYSIAYGLFKAIDPELFDEGMICKIITGRAEALLILEAWNTANPHSQVTVPQLTSNMRFALPLAGIEVITIPELNGTEKMYAMPDKLRFLGVDSPEDMQLEIKYNDYTDELKAECSFRLGTNIVWDKYFTRLELAAS